MRTRVFLLVTIAALLVAVPTVASAPGIAVVVNGQPIAASAVVINQSVYIPLRAVSESLGATVGWDGTTNTATVDLAQPAPVVVEKEVRVVVPVVAFDAVAIYEKARTASYIIDVRNSEGYGHGSGFAVGSPNTIVTAYHVIDHSGARIAALGKGGDLHPATVIATDTAHDIAVLRIQDPRDWATALELAAARPKVGAEVGLVSTPGDTLDFYLAMTVGRVALASNRNGSIVIDGTAYEGSSGGPFIDGDGKVVGMQATGYVKTPNFVTAIPAEAIAALLATVK